jgi:hypothetical protein
MSEKNGKGNVIDADDQRMRFELSNAFAARARDLQKQRPIADVLAVLDEQTAPARQAIDKPSSLTLVSSADLAAKDYSQEWLIRNILAKGHNSMGGGRKKTLKTTMLAVDLGLSIATGFPFLGEFDVPKPARVLIASGESGESVLQETAKRIARAKGFELADAKNLLWLFKVPKIGDRNTLQALSAEIRNEGIELLISDPAYLSLGDAAGDAGNIFAMGNAFDYFSTLYAETGCTPMLLHHCKNTGKADPFSPVELEDIAWAGFQEWAGQWLLLGRREVYDPESDGEHRLWMTVGGRLGQSGCWAVDVVEGRFSDPGGRRWEVSLSSARKARAEQAEIAAENKIGKRTAEQEATNKRRREKIIAALRQFPNGETESAISQRAGVHRQAFGGVWREMIEDKTVTECTVNKPNRKTPYDGWRLSK